MVLSKDFAHVNNKIGIHQRHFSKGQTCNIWHTSQAFFFFFVLLLKKGWRNILLMNLRLKPANILVILVRTPKIYLSQQSS